VTAEELSIWALESELRKAGHDQFSRSGTVLGFPSLAMEFLARDAKIQPHNDGFAAVVTFEARPPGADSTGIRILAVGFGQTEAAAAREAASQWVLGVFPALTSYLTQPEHLCEVEKSEMLVGVPDSGERYGWTVHLPPIIWRLWGASDIGPGDEPHVDSHDIYRAVFNAIHPFAAHRHMFWLECFASRYADGKVDATCRYNNKDWPEGRDALLAWASSWPDTNGYILSKRQFLIFEPTPVDRLSSSDRLSERMEQEISKSTGRWRKLLGRRSN